MPEHEQKFKFDSILLLIGLAISDKTEKNRVTFQKCLTSLEPKIDF